MKQDSNKSKLLVCLLSMGLLAVGTGCSDGDFDLSNIDTTIGIGSDGLELPTSSTEEIVLDDVLNLNNSDFVKISDNGDYIFTKEGDKCSPARPSINKVVVNPQSINENFRVDISLPSNVFASSKKSRRNAKSIDDIHFEGKVAEFNYSGNAPKEIVDLTSAGVSSEVAITVNPSEHLKSVVPTFKALTLSLPSYMELNITSCSANDYTYDKQSGVITMRNVSATSPIYINGVIKTLDFKKAASSDNMLNFTSGKNGKDGSVALKGIVKTGITINEVNVSGSTVLTDLYVKAGLSMGKITILSAKGRFAPDINLGELGSVKINDVPDFLTGDNVKLNLYNPIIELNINSNIGVAGKVKGKIIAEDKNKQVIASVDVPDMDIKPHTGTAGTSTTTKICICKYDNLIDKTKYDVVRKVENLSDLMFTIPKTLRFEADARADESKEAEVNLGTSYEITPYYSISAPLAFDEGAQIVYRDKFDGWNDDIDDLEFADGSYIELNANIVNKMPVYLNVNANAIDVNGKDIPDSRIEVQVSNSVKGCENASSPVTTPITITLKEVQKGALKSVDGLRFRVEAASGEEGSKSIVGQTINAYKHTLTARDIKIKVVGKIIADLN